MKNLLTLFTISLLLLCGCTNRLDEDLLSIEEKGDLAFARREYQTAVNLWSTAYLKNQNNIPLANKIGDAYFKLGKLDKAESFIQKAEQSDPENISTKMNLAQIYILLWKLPEAQKICEFLSEKGIDRPELDLIRADISLMTNEPDKAENYYRRAVIGSKDSLRALMKLAVFLKSSNRHEEAAEIFQIVHKHKGLPSQINLLSADYYLLENQYEKAEEAVLEAIKTEPEDVSLKYYLVKLYLSEEDNAKAEEFLETILNNHDEIYHRLITADVYILNSKLDKAEKIISELKKEITEPSAEFELLQGKYWLHMGKAVYASEHFEAAINLKPGLLNARYLLGLTHLINGKFKLSEKSLTGVLQIFPNHKKALLLISELLYKKEEYDLSLSYIERLIEQYPEEFTGCIIKGLNLIGQKKYELAKEAFIKSMYLNQSQAAISYYYLGLTEELLNHYTRAIQYYRQVLEINPELIDVSHRYCMMLLKTEQNRIADDFIKQKLLTGKDSPEKYYLAAKVALLTGKKSEGEAFLKKGIAFEDAPGYLYIKLADHYETEGKFEKVIEILEECIVRKPDFQEAWIKLCTFYIDRQEMALALETIQAGYQKFQDLPVFQSNLAWILLENHQETDRALKLAQDAYENDPGSVAFADTLGWAYYYKGIYSQAIWLLSEAEKKDPDNGFIKYHLGMTYYQKGEIEKAMEYLKSAEQSKESKYFAQNLSDILNTLSNKKPITLEGMNQKDIDESILSPPEIEKKDDDMILPQWKQ